MGSWARFPHTVTIYTAAGGVDDYGNPTPSAFTSATALGDYQPVTTDETRDGISAVDSDEVTFFFPDGTTVASSARLAVDGNTYEVMGPAVRRNTGSRLDYVRIRARRTAP